MEDLFFLHAAPRLNLRTRRWFSPGVVDCHSGELFFLSSLLIGMVPLDSVPLMLSPVKREFASLSETLTTSINSTHIWLLICVNALMLFPVLVESKPLLTESTFVLLDV